MNVWFQTIYSTRFVVKPGGSAMYLWLFLTIFGVSENLGVERHQRLRLARSCILARVLLHIGACANAALLTYLLTYLPDGVNPPPPPSQHPEKSSTDNTIVMQFDQTSK